MARSRTVPARHGDGFSVLGKRQPLSLSVLPRIFVVETDLDSHNVYAAREGQHLAFASGPVSRYKAANSAGANTQRPSAPSLSHRSRSRRRSRCRRRSKTSESTVSHRDLAPFCSSRSHLTRARVYRVLGYRVVRLRYVRSVLLVPHAQPLTRTAYLSVVLEVVWSGSRTSASTSACSTPTERSTRRNPTTCLLMWCQSSRQGRSSVPLVLHLFRPKLVASGHCLSSACSLRLARLV